jgi:hypothetical protein
MCKPDKFWKKTKLWHVHVTGSDQNTNIFALVFAWSVSHSGEERGVPGAAGRRRRARRTPGEERRRSPSRQRQERRRDSVEGDGIRRWEVGNGRRSGGRRTGKERFGASESEVVAGGRTGRCLPDGNCTSFAHIFTRFRSFFHEHRQMNKCIFHGLFVLPLHHLTRICKIIFISIVRANKKISFLAFQIQIILNKFHLLYVGTYLSASIFAYLLSFPKSQPHGSSELLCYRGNERSHIFSHRSVLSIVGASAAHHVAF